MLWELRCLKYLVFVRKKTVDCLLLPDAFCAPSFFIGLKKKKKVLILFRYSLFNMTHDAQAQFQEYVLITVG